MSDRIFEIASFLIITLVIVGLGFIIWTDVWQKRQLGIECIKSGKSVIEGSCVKVSP